MPYETYWCGILILKNNSSKLCLGSVLSIITLLQNPFFSVLLWEEKNLVFPFVPSLAPPVCLGACSTFLVLLSVRKGLCLHPRGRAGMVAGIPMAPPHPSCCPGRKHRAVSPFWLCASSLCSQAACDPRWCALASTGNGLTL